VTEELRTLLGSMISLREEGSMRLMLIVDSPHNSRKVTTIYRTIGNPSAIARVIGTFRDRILLRPSIQMVETMISLGMCRGILPILLMVTR
jgi:hypothetical protein